MPATNLAFANERREDRDDVHHRTLARAANGAALPLLIVNISPNGAMARCDGEAGVDQPLTLLLPGMAPMAATVRWALGGRIGCEFDHPLSPRVYSALLSRLGG